MIKSSFNFNPTMLSHCMQFQIKAWTKKEGPNTLGGCKILLWDLPFKTSACLRERGVSPCADGQKVTVHKDQKSPSQAFCWNADGRGVGVKNRKKIADALNGWSLFFLSCQLLILSVPYHKYFDNSLLYTIYLPVYYDYWWQNT